MPKFAIYFKRAGKTQRRGVEIAKEKPSYENHSSFIKRFKLKITPAELEKLDFAYVIAKYGHRNQLRESGERYFEHPRATAIILADELGITDIELIIAALLHDMLEDSFLLTPWRIKLIFGDRVSSLVSAMTKPNKNDARFNSDGERNSFYFQQLKKAGSDAKILKLADRLHNLRTLDSCLLEKRQRKAKEVKIFSLPLLNDIKEEYPKIAGYLSEKIKAAPPVFQD